MSFVYFLVGCIVGAIGMSGVWLLAVARYLERRDRLEHYREIRRQRHIYRVGNPI